MLKLPFCNRPNCGRSLQPVFMSASRPVVAAVAYWSSDRRFLPFIYLASVRTC